MNPIQNLKVNVRRDANSAAAVSTTVGSGFALQFVTQRAVIAPFEAFFGPLPLTRLDEVLEATRRVEGRFPTFGAALVSLHAQLVLSLPGDLQLCELILDWSSHIFSFRWVNSGNRNF